LPARAQIFFRIQRPDFRGKKFGFRSAFGVRLVKTGNFAKVNGSAEPFSLPLIFLGKAGWSEDGGGMETSSLVKELITEVWPRREEERIKITSRHVSRPPLLGALIALFECKRFIEQDWELLKKRRTYSRRQMWNEWDTFFDARGRVCWKNPNMRLWAIGYYLNRAQAATAASLDRLINLIFCYRMRIPLEEADGNPDWINFAYKIITDRAQMLYDRAGTRGIGTTSLERKLNELALAGDYFDTKDASDLLKDKRLCSRWIQLADVVTRVRKHLSGAQCAVAVFGRNNSFKHQVLGSYREGLAYLIDWAITATAIMWIASVWRAFVETTKSRHS
jgi:hypothetical protein